MPRRKKQPPSRLGFCGYCGKDSYDAISAQLALEQYANHPKRGRMEPVRFYPCPRGKGQHLTSQDKRSELRYSA